MDTIKITIRKGDEYRSRVACIYLEDAFFHDAYCKAGRCVGEIVAATEYYESAIPEPDFKKPCLPETVLPLSDFAKLAAFPNNIIAFCGKRGQGKTSAMVSFAKALEHRHEVDTEQARKFWNACAPELRHDCRFIVIDPIDPTSLERTDSILRIILSRLFKKFQETWQKRAEQEGYFSANTYQNEKQKDELLQDFRECYRMLDTLKEGRREDQYYDDLSYLADLGDSSFLKTHFTKLVRDYCTFYSNPPGQGYLLLQIDDTDLNTQHAFEILEDLRKYFVIPHVIMLMATELQQLELIVEQHHAKEFSDLINCYQKSNGQQILERIDCHSAAELYLDKLLPGNHQIHLPTLDGMPSEEWQRLDVIYHSNGKECFPNHDALFQKKLLGLIYQKTHIVLLEPQFSLHPLLPNQMRSLTHFLSFLDSLADLPGSPEYLTDDEKARRNNILRQNIHQLEQYFRQTWCRQRLPAREYAEIEKLFPVPAPDLHQQAARSLQALGFRGSTKKDDTAAIDYANVMLALREQSSTDSSSRFEFFRFAVEFHYTLLMHKMVLEDKEEDGDKLKKLVDFTGLRPVLFPDVSGKSKYAQFKVDLTQLQALSENDINVLRTWITGTCVGICNDESVKAIDTDATDLTKLLAPFSSLEYNAQRMIYKDASLGISGNGTPADDDSTIPSSYFLMNTDLQNYFFQFCTLSKSASFSDFVFELNRAYTVKLKALIFPTDSEGKQEQDQKGDVLERFWECHSDAVDRVPDDDKTGGTFSVVKSREASGGAGEGI